MQISVALKTTKPENFRLKIV